MWARVFGEVWLAVAGLWLEAEAGHWRSPNQQKNEAASAVGRPGTFTGSKPVCRKTAQATTYNIIIEPPSQAEQLPATKGEEKIMEQASMDVAEIQSRIEEYSSFISSTLRPQLEAAAKAREEVERDIKEYEALQAKLANMTSTAKPTREKIISANTCSSDDDAGEGKKDQTETVVDLGHEVIYCKAVIDDPSKIYVHTGMGFHVEMTMDEAAAFIGKRIRLLRQSLELKTQKATTIAVHIEETILVLQQLGNEVSPSQE